VLAVPEPHALLPRLRLPTFAPSTTRTMPISEVRLHEVHAADGPTETVQSPDRTVAVSETQIGGHEKHPPLPGRVSWHALSPVGNVPHLSDFDLSFAYSIAALAAEASSAAARLLRYALAETCRESGTGHDQQRRGAAIQITCLRAPRPW
jgi:hypothetical protein